MELEPAIPAATRVVAAQIDALFGAVTIGVCAAAIGACLMTHTLYVHGDVPLGRGACWVGFIATCAAAHVLLRQLYKHAGPARRPRLWGGWFTAIAFAEGLGWGWAPVYLTSAGQNEAGFIVLIAMLAIAGGAVPAFSAYLPAFFGIFLPATLPFLFASITAADPLRHALYLLMLVYIGGMGGLALVTNRDFKRLVALRIRTEEMAEDLKRQKDIAEQANHAKSAFLAAASHDLRQPVHALGLFVGALRGVQMAPEGLRMLEQIEASTDAMDGLFTALLDISRLDAGTVEVHTRPFAIGPLLARIGRDHAGEAQDKNLALRVRDCALVIESDPVLTERILRNLVANAVRYTSRGGVLVSCRRRGMDALLQVWDTGIGISPGQEDKIFQEFYQLGNPERDRTKGLGLGLAIVLRLTILLDCHVSLRSVPGRGSCFAVSLPLATGPAAQAAPVLEAPPGMAQGLIVVVDDESVIRDGMAQLLAGWGFTPAVAASGDEALASLSGILRRPDLLICDYRLRGGESGITVIERLRAEFNDPIPAILITGDTAPGRLAEAQASGLLLLHKPVSNGRLRAAITNLLAAQPETTALE
jgi:signal transduction histidine kinase/CheY-like chemotaxis protein